MSSDLVPFDLALVPAMSDEQFEDIENTKTGGAYLQRLQLAASSCDLCKTGKTLPGVWIIPTGGGECTILGDTIDVLPIALRHKAMDMTDRQNIIVNYDHHSDEYARIKALKKKAYWGHSLLVIERKTANPFELYFGNKSGREESGNIIPFLPRGERQSRPATLSIRLIEGKEFSWHVPVITKCSEPFTSGPDVATIIAERDRFLNPKVDEVEVEEETKTKGRAR